MNDPPLLKSPPGNAKNKPEAKKVSARMDPLLKGRFLTPLVLRMIHRLRGHLTRLRRGRLLRERLTLNLHLMKL